MTRPEQSAGRREKGARGGITDLGWTKLGRAERRGVGEKASHTEGKKWAGAEKGGRPVWEG